MAKRYLWSNMYGGEQTVYIYLNENGQEIYGHMVADIDTGNPYSEKSVYKKGKYEGVAKEFVSSMSSNNNRMMGLTDINKTEYNKLYKAWVIPSKNN